MKILPVAAIAAALYFLTKNKGSQQPEPTPTPTPEIWPGYDTEPKPTPKPKPQEPTPEPAPIVDLWPQPEPQPKPTPTPEPQEPKPTPQEPTAEIWPGYDIEPTPTARPEPAPIVDLWPQPEPELTPKPTPQEPTAEIWPGYDIEPTPTPEPTPPFWNGPATDEAEPQPTPQEPTPTPKPTQPTPTIELGSATAQPGELVAIPVYFRNFGTQPINSITLHIKLDKELAELVEIKSWRGSRRDLIEIYHNSNSNFASFVWYDMAGFRLINEEPLFYFVFKLKEPANIELKFTDRPWFTNEVTSFINPIAVNYEAGKISLKKM
jgi:hypothetical protein